MQRMGFLQNITPQVLHLKYPIPHRSWDIQNKKTTRPSICICDKRFYIFLSKRNKFYPSDKYCKAQHTYCYSVVAAVKPNLCY